MNTFSVDANVVWERLRKTKESVDEHAVQKWLGDDADRLYGALDELAGAGFIHWEDGEVILLKAGRRAMIKPGIFISLGMEGLTGGYQLSINEVDKNGDGTGYRLAGPKFSGCGHEIMKTRIDKRAAKELIKYAEKALGDE